uniref:Uncharacterized protein n=1 Tax=Globodera rostochiensis TaxID=31243 RepID=A0A914HQG0_GLORO
MPILATSADHLRLQPKKPSRILNYTGAKFNKDQRGRLICTDNSHDGFHIIVEFVAGEGCIKYLCKYMMKGAGMESKSQMPVQAKVRLTTTDCTKSVWLAIFPPWKLICSNWEHRSYGMPIEAAQAEEERRNQKCQDDALHLIYATAYKNLWYGAAKKE